MESDNNNTVILKKSVKSCHAMPKSGATQIQTKETGKKDECDDVKPFNCNLELSQGYKCSSCTYRTHLKVNLTSHLAFIHCQRLPNSNLREYLREVYECPRCDFRSSSLLVFIKHVVGTCPRNEVGDQSTTSVYGKWFECDRCPFKSTWNRTVKLHILYKHTSHEEGVWFQCTRCVYKSREAHLVTAHFGHVHTAEEEKWYQCKDCSLKTKSRSTLRNHVLARHRVMATL